MHPISPLAPQVHHKDDPVRATPKAVNLPTLQNESNLHHSPNSSQPTPTKSPKDPKIATPKMNCKLINIKTHGNNLEPTN